MRSCLLDIMVLARTCRRWLKRPRNCNCLNPTYLILYSMYSCWSMPLELSFWDSYTCYCWVWEGCATNWYLRGSPNGWFQDRSASSWEGRSNDWSHLRKLWQNVSHFSRLPPLGQGEFNSPEYCHTYRTWLGDKGVRRAYG